MELNKILESYRIGRDGENMPASERHELVGKFVSRLNATRKENGFKELPAKFFAIKMADAGLKTNSDLYWFYRYCEDAKDFGKCWWWALKAK